MKRTFNAYSTKGKWTFTVYTHTTQQCKNPHDHCPLKRMKTKHASSHWYGN